MDWTSKVVLVVGGTADSGRAVVRTVADAGGTVAFTYNRSESEADALLEDCSGSGHSSWRCDVTDRDDVSAVVEDVFEEHGSVDAIVYTVGVISRDPIGELPAASWANHLDANVTGAFNVVSSATPHLKAQGSGAIVALSASPGVLRSTDLAAYDASKRALEAFIEETARELGPHGIRANVVAPGFIRDPDALSEDAKRDLYDQQPYERLTTPQTIANASLFLCSDAAGTITGAILPVDSGLALQ